MPHRGFLFTCLCNTNRGLVVLVEHRATRPLQHDVTNVTQRNELFTEAEISRNELSFRGGGRNAPLSLTRRGDRKTRVSSERGGKYTR
eukprot:3285368-Lingulodinium_polyedra.AAC.1